MSTFPQSIRRDWDYYFRRIESNKNLSEERKEYISNGFRLLRNFFGDDWSIVCSQKKHPFFLGLWNEAEWNLCRYADLGYALKKFNKIQGFPFVKGRLFQPDQYYSVICELALAWKLAPSTELLVFSSKVEGSSSRPDIKASIGGKNVFFELTVLRSSQEERIAQKTMEETGLDSPINLAGEILRIRSKLMDKLDQLPKNSPGIAVICTPAFPVLHFPDVPFLKIATFLEGTFQNKPDVVAAVIGCRVSSVEDPAIKELEDNKYLITTSYLETINTAYLFVHNQNSPHQLKRECLNVFSNPELPF